MDRAKKINITVCHLKDEFLNMENTEGVSIFLDASQFYANNACMRSMVLWNQCAPHPQDATLSDQEIRVPVMRGQEGNPTTILCFDAFENPDRDDINIFTEKGESDAIVFIVSAKSLFKIAANNEVGWTDYFYGLFGYPKILPLSRSIAKLSSLYELARTANNNRLQNDVWIIVTDLEDFKGSSGFMNDLWFKHCPEIHFYSRVVLFQPDGAHKEQPMSMMMNTIVATCPRT